MQRTEPGVSTVLVTGASGGIGSATVARLAAAGWTVFAGVRDLSSGEALAATSDGQVVPVVLDVTVDGSIASARRELGGRLGGSGLGGLVNNAGILVEGPVELLATEDMRRQFEVNVIGAMAVTRELLPLLRAARGRIVNVGAVTGRTPVPYLGASSASKAALAAFTDALRVEVHRFGVDVSIVEPTPIETSIFDTAAGEAERSRARADAAVRTIYEAGIEAVSRAIAKGGSSPVEVVSRAIERALTARRPRTRYPVGRRAHTVAALRFAPDRVRDALLERELGLRGLPAAGGS